MKSLLEIIARYGTEKDTERYWKPIVANHRAAEIVQNISKALRHDNLRVVQRACVFTQHAMLNYGPQILKSRIIGQIEKIAASDNVRTAHTAVFVLGRIGSKKSLKKLKAILANGPHRDLAFVRNLKTNIQILSK